MDVCMMRLGMALVALATMGAKYETANFVVSAPSADVARNIALAAEEYRRDLALSWLGEELPQWGAPCRLLVKSDRPLPSGHTSFVFNDGEVYDWEMIVQGPVDTILESVLPHEISHTIFASYFRCPVPRWADEGASLLAEDDAERRRQRALVGELLENSRRIPLRDMVTLVEYPRDHRQVMALYAQGHSVAEFLVLPGGRTRYLAFLKSAARQGWDRALQRHYGFRNIEELERYWSEWVRNDCPTLQVAEGQLLVSALRETPSDTATVHVVGTVEHAIDPSIGGE